jgi:uncharacterized protein (DUF58 family)
MPHSPAERVPGIGDGLVFEADFLRKLERLELLARKMFRGHLRGEHTTPRRGRGLEFSDFRRYRPGDDFRHIDWNIFSRLDRLFLKLYASEEDVTLHLLLDASASMGFGAPRKFDHARRLAAALAYIGLVNLDRVGINSFADGLGARLAPVKARHHLTSVLHFLRGLDCQSVTRFAPSLREFATRMRNPGLVVLISDLMVADDLALGLEALRHRGHDVVVLQLLSEEEIDPPLDGALRLLDAEDGSALNVTVDAELRALYRARLDAHLEHVESYCRKRGVEYLRASTVIPFEDVILKYLRQGALIG